jgi:hypothetical protein
MSDCFKKGKGKGEKAVPHSSENCYDSKLRLAFAEDIFLVYHRYRRLALTKN